MGIELDLDDVAATSPLAMRELAELRADAVILEDVARVIDLHLKTSLENMEKYRADQNYWNGRRDSLAYLRNMLGKLEKGNES